MTHFRAQDPPLRSESDIGDLWFDTSEHTLWRYQGEGSWVRAQTALAVEDDDHWLREYDDGIYMVLREPNQAQPKFQIIKDRRLYGVAKSFAAAMLAIDDDRQYQINRIRPVPIKTVPDHYGGW